MAGTADFSPSPLAATRTTATQTPASFERGHPDSGKSKRQIREARSDKKTEKRIGSDLTAALNEEKRIGNDLMAALTEPTWSPSANSSGAGGDLWSPSPNSSWQHVSTHLQPTWAPRCGGYGAIDHAGAAAAHGGCEQHALNRVQRRSTGGPAAASAAEAPKRALVNALQNDLAGMLVRLKRLEELLSA